MLRVVLTLRSAVVASRAPALLPLTMAGGGGPPWDFCRASSLGVLAAKLTGSTARPSLGLVNVAVRGFAPVPGSELSMVSGGVRGGGEVADSVGCVRTRRSCAVMTADLQASALDELEGLRLSRSLLRLLLPTLAFVGSPAAGAAL